MLLKLTSGNNDLTKKRKGTIQTNLPPCDKQVFPKRNNWMFQPWQNQLPASVCG